MSSEAKRREVLQLLKDYRTYHTPYGGAGELNLEALGQFGPGGLIMRGAAFPKEHRALLAESYDNLEHALTLLKGDGPDGYMLWLVLFTLFLSDPGDPSLLEEWQKKRPIGYENAMEAIRFLADKLAHRDLYVVWPKRISSREEKQVERMNDEFFMTYRTLRQEGHRKRQSIQQAATMCGYSETRGYEIVRIREQKESA